MKTIVNVHMIECDNFEQSIIVVGVTPNWCQSTKSVINDTEWRKFGKPKHIYFTIPQSDLEISKIKDGDCVVVNINGICKVTKVISLKGANSTYSVSIKEGYINPTNCEKIVACTDDLEVVSKGINPVYERLPSIPKSFIKRYITEYNNGNVIKTAEIELECRWNRNVNRNIPTKSDLDDVIKLTPNNEVVVVPIVDKMYTRDEVIKILHNSLDAWVTDNTPFRDVFGRQLDKWIEENL
jgi:nitrous oxide reductase